MERALLAVVQLKHDRSALGIEDAALELEELTRACGAEVVQTIATVLEKPTPNLYLGKGKAEEIAELCWNERIDTVILSQDLSGTQQRNLEAVVKCKTIDRTQLILDIFARRARTPEGKMQVELAQLQYLLPRLIGKGVILSRLGGGIGTRGPGEQKLEIDRRRIRQRIDRLRLDLKGISVHRTTLRKRRKDRSIPSVALVGYTNAGKSTLLNALTGAGQVVRNSLFTTLDPLTKSMALPNGEQVVVSDTVGFLQNLPHHLIEAFKATLEEVVESDLLLHVMDASNPLLTVHREAVLEVLGQLGAEKKPRISVLNKIDRFDVAPQADSFKEQGIEDAVLLSALQGTNLQALVGRIESFFFNNTLEARLFIPHSQMNMLPHLYRMAKVKGRSYVPEGMLVSVLIRKEHLDNLLKNKMIRSID